jgi:Ca-activated chloride channel family protein
MSLQANDPRLTAYALGELSQREAAILEAELDESPDGQRALVEIRKTADLLRAALASELAPELTTEIRERIIAGGQVTSANGEVGAAASPEATPVRIAARGAHAPVRPAPVRPAARPVRWARRYWKSLAAASVSIVGLAILAVPVVRSAREVARHSRVANSLRQSGLAIANYHDSLSWQKDDIRYAPSESNVRLGDQLVDQMARNPQRPARFATVGESTTMPAAPQAAPSDSPPALLYAPAQQQSQIVPLYAPVPESAPLATETLASQDRRQAGEGQTSGRPALMGGQPAAAGVGLVIRGRASEQQSGEYTIVGQYRAYPSSGEQADRSGGGGAQGGKAYFTSGGAEGRGADKQTLNELKLELDEAIEETKTAEGQGEAGRAQRQGRLGKNQLADIRDTLALKQELLKRRKLVGEKLAELEAAEQANTEAYDAIVENPFQAVAQNPLSTFSIDVDTASYANVRRFLNQGLLPPPGAVRIEELVNYFRYDYAGPKDNEPFAANADVAVCPWAPEHRLVRIGLKGRELAADNRPASNLVFLVDVSGSMRDANKLPLVKDGLRLLVEKLGENDRVAMVVYAGASGLVLPSTLGTHKEKIMYAIDSLEAGGSTNGASGIQLAYDTAVAHFVKGGANRVILATDGDFNVGITDQSQLVDLIEKKAASGVFLSVLGFGMGNYKDSNLEKLADKGNGNYAYIDTLAEARKVLVEELSGTLVTIAKDVKIQIEFNPAKVQAYRLIGYENRMLAKEDFNNDKKDAGEIGAGHTVTALYELVPAGAAAAAEATASVDKLEYQTESRSSDAAQRSNDLLTLKLRYKEPDGAEGRLLKFPVADREQQIGAAGDDFEFAAAVAGFGMLLRGSAHKGPASYATVLELAQASLGADKEGYRREFVELVKKAAAVTGPR